MRRPVVLAILAAVAAVTAAAATAGGPRRLWHVTFVGDSVAASIAFEPTARPVLTRGDDVDFELASCRRLATPSCFVAGMTPPPTALDTLTQLGSSAGPIVVIDVGYNDDSYEYRAGMNLVLARLRADGVKRVVWLTLRERWHDYISINNEIRAAARTRSWLTVADWNRYSRSHPAWFQPDGIHLEAAGADALAVFVHRTLARLGLTGAVQPRRRRARRSPTSSATPVASSRIRAAAVPAARPGSRPAAITVAASARGNGIGGPAAAFVAALGTVAAVAVCLRRGGSRRRRRDVPASRPRARKSRRRTVRQA
jgi:hypothetical protein